MLDMPILKFEKSTKYLQKQLEVQKNNKQLVLDIITNIGLISKDSSYVGTDYESALDSANLFLQTITSNISTIEQLDIEIKNITNDLTNIISESSKPSKAKEFYITSFTNIKQAIVTYSKKIRELETKLYNDNRDFNDFIKENNIKYIYETKDADGNSDSYEFTGFSLNNSENIIDDEEGIDESALIDNSEEIIDNDPIEILQEKVIEPEEPANIISEGPIDTTEYEPVSFEEVSEEPVNNEESNLSFSNMEDLISDVIKESTQGINVNSFDYEPDIDLDTISSEFSLADLDMPEPEETEEESDENNQDLTQTLLNHISDNAGEIDSLLSSLITEEDLNSESGEDLSELSLRAASNMPVNENVLDNVEGTVDNSKPSYSQMYSNFYPSPQKENKVLTIDFSSLENSFKEFDKILSEKPEADSEPVFSDESVIEDNDSPIQEEAEIVEEVKEPEVQSTPVTNNVEDLISDDDLLDLLSEEDIEESILADESIASDDINPEGKTQEEITSLFDKQISRIEQGSYDNETLLISERTEKIYLPYKTTELLNYIHSYPNLYKSLSDVVKQEFVLPYTYFVEHPSKSRFSEAYNLIRNREGKNVISATAFAIRMSHKRNLNPAIIASCKTKSELDNYLYCLNSNKLDKFKAFKIAYEVNPV